MKKFIYNLIILLLGLFVILAAVSTLHTSKVLISIGTTSSITLGVLLIIVSILISGIGGLVISQFKLVD